MSDSQIIEWLMPIVSDVRQIPYGWLVPIATITLCSFPPLFGSGEFRMFCRC